MKTHHPPLSVSDIELLEELCSQEDDALFYAEFVKRFMPDVKEECQRICKRRKLHVHIGNQIAHEKFEKIRKYKSFKKDKISIPNTRKAIILYLVRMSVNLFNDYHNQQKRQEVVHKTYFDDILESVGVVSDLKALKNKKDLALKIFSKLNKKEQRVVLVDIEYKKHQKYLPDEVTQSLSEELNVRKGTIRKIRDRAIEKIKKAIHEINQE